MSLEKKAADSISRVFPDKLPVFTLALSGGRDSVCLLFCLHQLMKQGMRFSLEAVHVHHRMRQEADRDEAFCRNLCDTWQIPYQAVYVDVPLLIRKQGLSAEEAARRLRYEALFQAAKGGVIVLAHHQKDQAETLLLHLLRGTSLKGLGGMKELSSSEFGDGKLFRPLLHVTEEELEEIEEEDRGADRAAAGGTVAPYRVQRGAGSRDGGQGGGHGGSAAGDGGSGQGHESANGETDRSADGGAGADHRTPGHRRLHLRPRGAAGQLHHEGGSAGPGLGQQPELRQRRGAGQEHRRRPLRQLRRTAAE